MSPSETLERVRSVNPVPTPPPAPPITPLLGRLDRSVRALDAPFPRQTPKRSRPTVRPRIAAGLAVAVALAIAALALLGSPGGGGVSVAAAVDRAVTPGPGVLHMVIDSENLVGEHVTTTTHEELWTAQSPRRQRTISTLQSGGETVESEGAVVSVDPPRALRWLRSDPSVIHEDRSPVAQTVPTPVAWLHTAYQQGRLKVLGRSELNGRPTWRLSVQRDPAQPAATLNGQPLPTATVLVDARSFAPLENTVYSVGSQNNRGVLLTTRVHYVTYEELPAGADDESLLRMASHPGARIVEEPATVPGEH
ncbi:MAG TPA: hypothetical protein VGN13_10950 [Solirubrobacteraceae bacterium]|jgi:hypothetical protein